MSTTLVQNPDGRASTPAGRPRGDRKLVASALVVFLLAWGIRTAGNLDVEAQNYRARAAGASAIVGGDWFAGMLLGFREAVADLMWIQVDEYFHEGRFDKILPLCYIITAMDPGWVEVYTTGAWHLGYNFGDRRLVPGAIRFARRGVENNPLNSDMVYEVANLEMSRAYDFKSAARDFKKANDLGLLPSGRRHAWPHALESAGDIQGAIRAWQQIYQENPSDVVAKKQILLANIRLLARKDLKKNPIQVHLDVKVIRKGPRVLDIAGVTNLPKLSRVYFELRDADWRDREKQSLGWQMAHYTEYSQQDTTLEPQVGLFRGEAIDFYQGSLRIHQGEKTYEQFPTEPPLPIKDGHMVVGNGYFHTEIDMAKEPEQYPLESGSYELELLVNPRWEPISTQDVIDWDGSGMSGPLCHWVDGTNELIWTMNLSKNDIEPGSSR